MRSVEALKYVSGSIVVYFVMAACSAATTNGTGPSGTNGNNAGGSANGSGSAGGNGSGSATGNGNATGGGNNGSSPVPDAQADPAQSGSRLKATYYVGGDGSKQFAYWQDTGRNNERCDFMTAGDGTVRCLPSGGVTDTAYFANATCNEPVGMMSTGCATPAYVTFYDYGGGGYCATYKIRVYPVTGVITTGTSVYVLSGGTCTAVAQSTAYTYFKAGAEIPAATFQGAQAQVE